MVVNQGNGEGWLLLDEGVIKNCSQVVAIAGFASSVEVVVEGCVK